MHMARNRGRRLPLPLPKNTVVCGELILDPSQPHNAVMPLPDDLILDVRSTPFHNVHTSDGSAIGAEFGLQLMTFLKAQAKFLHLNQVDIKVPRADKYLVRDSETAFKEACGNKMVRTWLEKRVIDEGRTAAMIVGMYTYTNATYTHTHTNQLGGGISGSSSSASGNESAGGSAGAVSLNYQAFNSPEEQIFAIEYKFVKFKLFKKKKVEDARLEVGQNRWVFYFGDRSKGVAVTASDEENILQFDLEDDESKSHAIEDKDDDDDEEEELEESENGKKDQGVIISMDFAGSLVDEVET